jgi:chromosome segregation ATPase
LNENNRLIEKQEDLLFEEHDKVVEVEKSLALELMKNEMLSTELSSCHSSISSLKNDNDDLNARIEKFNVASSSLEHVSICTRCKDFDINDCSDHASTIVKLNDEIAECQLILDNVKSS